MIKIPGIKGQSFGVFGLGATGVAAADALIASGADVYSWDENPSSREKIANTEYRAEEPVNWPWERLDALVLSPGVPLTHPTPHDVVRRAREAGVEIIGDVELMARAINAWPNENTRPKIVAVTGSNGKSTTTSLIAHMLRETGHLVHEGGNLGRAVLDLPALEDNSIYVLELSSFQLDLIHTMRADVSVLLNISPDHLDRHGGMDGYISAKRRIFRNQTNSDHAIVGVDEQFSQSICTDLISVRKVTVTPISALGTLGGGVFALAGSLFYNFDNKTTKAGKVPDVPALKGQHNHQNAAAALGACCRLGVSPPVALLAMSRFKGLTHRMEKVTDISDVTFINDSKATNCDAAMQALSAYPDIFWLAGGKLKEGGIDGLVTKLSSVRHAYFFGEAAQHFNEQVGKRIETTICPDLETAFNKAYGDAVASGLDNPVILLSPAAASYDQFKNFEDRGNKFKSLVEALSTRLSAKGGAAA